LPDEEIAGCLDVIVFNIGMIELVSYWKATCSPKVVIRPFSLHPEQITWWKNLYYHGLGEFFYLNGIHVDAQSFMDIELAAAEAAPCVGGGANLPRESAIIPVGGGKDSVVTLELLGSLPGNLPLIMNPRGASLETIFANGFTREQLIEVHRTIDPELLKLNELGFLNGHTPFSALLAFVTVLAAMITGRRNIALSNESSANEATIEGTDINHQYSKSFQFESGFRTYVKKWICTDVNYFSFLRPLNELQIAAVFSRFTKYHPVFKSCNAGSKTDSWCGHCAKCLFTFIILSPFLHEVRLVQIFGKNLLEDESLRPVFDQLTGTAEEKPFDCVGTIREVNLAMCETIRLRKDWPLPYLAGYYRSLPACQNYCRTDFNAELEQISPDHFLPPPYLDLLNHTLHPDHV
jgi:hypothetical protein